MGGGGGVKDCGSIAITNVNKRSRKFYTEEDDD